MIPERNRDWTLGDSNPRPPRCKRGDLPTDLRAHFLIVWAPIGWALSFFVRVKKLETKSVEIFNALLEGRAQPLPKNSHFLSPEILETVFPETCISGKVKGGDPSAGSPTDTLLQLSPSCETGNHSTPKKCCSFKLYSNGLMGGVCKTQGHIHRAMLTRDY